MDGQGFYIIWSFGNPHDTFIIKGVLNSNDQLRSTSSKIQRAADVIDAWCLHRNIRCLMNICTFGAFICGPDFVRELESLSDEVREYTGLKYSFGVGLDTKEAEVAMRYALGADKAIALYAEAVENMSDDEEDDLGKGEAVAPLIDLLHNMATILPGIKDESVSAALQQVAKKLTTVAKSVAAARTKLPMRKGQGHKYPAAATFNPTAGIINDGKIKVKPVDPHTGKEGKTGWNGARAGMIRSKGDTAISSRQPETE